LLEAVVALELALGAFADNPEGHRLPDAWKGRVAAEGIKALIDKVGLRGAFALVIPILVSEDRLPSAVLDGCRAAIEARNNVIHNAQRDVPEHLLIGYLTNIQTCCVSLEGRSER
jgi:hypothetical protein